MNLRKIFTSSIKAHCLMILFVFSPFATFFGRENLSFLYITLCIFMIIGYIAAIIIFGNFVRFILPTKFALNPVQMSGKALGYIFFIFVIFEAYLIFSNGIQVFPLFAVVDYSHFVSLNNFDKIGRIYLNQILLGAILCYFHSTSEMININKRFIIAFLLLATYSMMGYSEFGGRRTILSFIVIYFFYRKDFYSLNIQKASIKFFILGILSIVAFWYAYQTIRGEFGNLIGFGSDEDLVSNSTEGLESLGFRAGPFDILYLVIKSKFEYNINTFPDVIIESMRFASPLSDPAGKIHPDVIIASAYPALINFKEAVRIDISSSLMLDLISDLGILWGTSLGAIFYVVCLVAAFSLLKTRMGNFGLLRINIYGLIFSYILSIETGFTNFISIWIAFLLSCCVSFIITSVYLIIRNVAIVGSRFHERRD